jgi:hypothetical protein
MHTSGTAANYLDLLNRFVTFVTTGLTTGQNWTLLADTTDGGTDRAVYLQAPGLAGTDTIFVNIGALHSTSADTYNLILGGATGYLSSAHGFNLQPGASPGGYLSLWDAAIPFWFIADGRSAKIVAKVATVYESAYLGLFVPYATPTEYPYPLFVGGTSPNDCRYSDLSWYHSAFWNPSSVSNPFDYTNYSGASLRLPAGEWATAGNINTYNNSFNYTGLVIWPFGIVEGVGCVLGSSDYALMPLVLHINGLNAATLGELDGVFFISGYQNASENIVTINGIDHLVVQNCFRTSGPAVGYGCNNQFAAFALTTD